MSGSTIGGVVGAAVGFWVGGPAGAQWGWMIGSAVGGYVDPEQIQGPRLSDARAQTSRDGVAIPFGWGTFPLAGNIIWQQPGVTEHKDTSTQGKGGPEVTEYRYTRSYAIGLCEGPITGILQVKRNGKLVYDARDDATLEEEGDRGGLTGARILELITGIRAGNAGFLDKCAIYLGDETQTPDPTIEAYEGVGNVPAYRGLAYIVVTDDDVTDLQGAIPQYEFVVVTEGTSAATDADGLVEGRLSEFTDGEWPLSEGESNYTYVGYRKDLGLSTYSSFSADTIDEILDHFASHYGETRPVTTYLGYSAHTAGVNGIDGSMSFSGVKAQPSVEDNQRLVLVYNEQAADFAVDAAASTLCPVIPYPGADTVSPTYVDKYGVVCFLETDSDSGSFGAYEFYNNCNTLPDNGGIFPQIWGTEPVYIHVSRKRVAKGDVPDGAIEVPDAPGFYVLADGSLVQGFDTFVEVAGTHKVLAAATAQSIDGRDQYAWYETGPVLAVGDPDDTQAFWEAEYAEAVAAGDLPAGWTYGVQYPTTVSSAWEASSSATDVITPDPVVLSQIVANLCEREGLTSGEYDVSQLTDVVPGFRIANEGDAASAIAALMPSYFFDCAEWDGKVRFIKRGGTSVFAINGDDLVERDGDPFERERVQEAELLRRVTVGYVDPEAAYGPTTQKWERRVGTVQAKGEASAELPLTLEADTAATIAKRRGLTAWGEPEKQKFSLPYRLAALTPTDIGTYTDADGEVHYIRLMQVEDDSGIREIESSTNSAEAYGATATGVIPLPPTITESGLIGPTNLAVMDLPIWRTTDSDDIGLYVAGCGYLGGWYGAQLDVSTDEGVSYATAAQIDRAATIGYTTSALVADVSSEYPSGQSLTVTLPDAPSSVSYEALLRYNNRAALQLDSGGWEILQYQTVTANGDDSYTLSGLLRGRYNTTPGAAAAESKFVLLDGNVQFVKAERDYMGQSLTLRATSYGTSSDAAPTEAYSFPSSPASQTEWPVHSLAATRDGSNNVAVTWVGRARLGTETSPYHSTHFSAYRVSWTDGVTTETADTTDTSYTISSAADPIDVTVYPLNDITGAGPASETITV